MSSDWRIVNPEIHAGRVPWVRRVADSEICKWYIYGDPDDPKADFDLILIGKPCPNLTRWRFDATEESEVESGPYCYSHIRKIIDTPEEIGRFWKLVEYRQQDERNRRAWRGTP